MKSKIFILDNKYNSEKYDETLEKGLIPIISPGIIFQQDNAPIQVSKFTRNWLLTNNITTLNWPARSPDLNIVENVWATMSKDVCSHGKQFNSIVELQTSVIQSWDNINQDYVRNMYKSMYKRLLYVINRKGDMTKY